MNQSVEQSGPPAAAAPALAAPPLSAHADSQPAARPLIKHEWRKRVIAGAAAGALLLILAVTRNWNPPQQSSRFVLPVTRASFVTELEEIGSIQALLETPVLSRFTGEVIWKIDEGTFVEPGDPVVRFDTKSIEEDIENREKDLVERQEAVKKAKADIDTTRKRYENIVKWHEINVQVAGIARSRVFDMPDYDDRKEAELNLKIAQLELQKLEIETKGYAELAKQGFLAEAAYNKKLLELKTQQTNHAKARTIYDLTLQGADKITKYLADLKLADARRRLEIFKFNRDADLKALNANLELAQMDLTLFEREMAQRREELEFGTARAPVRGRVAFREVFKGSMKNKSPIQVGETRNLGSELCTICDTSVLRINLLVNEADIKNVAVGQKARVKLPAFPDRIFEAAVSRIGVQAQDKNVALSGLAVQRSGEAFVNVVNVRLDFVNLSDADRNEMRVGFTAQVTLQTSDAADALVVPWAAVRYGPDGAAYCELAGTGEIRMVRLGRSDNERVEVLEGLHEKDEVYAAARRDAGKGG